MDRGAGQASVHGIANSWTGLWDYFHFQNSPASLHCSKDCCCDYCWVPHLAFRKCSINVSDWRWLFLPLFLCYFKWLLTDACRNRLISRQGLGELKFTHCLRGNSGGSEPDAGSWLCCLLLYANYLSSLCLIFIIRKMRTIMEAHIANSYQD